MTLWLWWCMSPNNVQPGSIIQCTSTLTKATNMPMRTQDVMFTWLLLCCLDSMLLTLVSSFSTLELVSLVIVSIALISFSKLCSLLFFRSANSLANELTLKILFWMFWSVITVFISWNILFFSFSDKRCFECVILFRLLRNMLALVTILHGTALHWDHMLRFVDKSFRLTSRQDDSRKTSHISSIECGHCVEFSFPQRMLCG